MAAGACSYGVVTAKFCYNKKFNLKIPTDFQLMYCIEFLNSLNSIFALDQTLNEGQQVMGSR
jgi:hypothetical protein